MITAEMVLGNSDKNALQNENLLDLRIDDGGRRGTSTG